MSGFSNSDNQDLHHLPSMEEVIQYEIHGKPQPIKLRRASREYSQSFLETWHKPLPFNSFFLKEADMNVNAEDSVVRRKCPLEADEELTIASSSSHECLTRPCTCPDPGKSKEMCVIKKVEHWLHSKCMDVDESETIKSPKVSELSKMPKWPNNINERPELENHAVSSLPHSVMLRKVEGSMYPYYLLNVRVVGIEPELTDLSQVVRGYCPHYTCHTVVVNIDWSKSGPLNYGKLTRPFCPECCQTRRKRYLNLYFHLVLRVEDNSGQMLKIVIDRDVAVRFFGLTVYKFLCNLKKRLKIKRHLETFLAASSAPRSAPIPGVTFDIRIMPVAKATGEEVKFHLYGDNIPLSELAKKSPVARL